MGNQSDRSNLRRRLKISSRRCQASFAPFIEQGLPCIVCGQPVWDALEEMAKEKGRLDQEMDRLITNMNSRLVPGEAR
jgi:hypothetical protein